MEVQEEKFDFPEVSELKHLVGHISKSQINKAILKLKNSQKYRPKRITYRLNEWNPYINGKRVGRVSVKFSCCGDKDTCPALFFIKIKQHFLLLKRSRFTHTHSNSINSVDGQSSLRTFEFPDKEELKEFSPCANQDLILTTLNRLLQKPIHQGKKVKYMVLKKETQDKQAQQVIYHKIIRFQCCKSYNNASYLHFVSNDNKQFTLKDYSLQHNHYRSHLHKSQIEKNSTIDKNILSAKQCSWQQEKDQDNSAKSSQVQQSNNNYQVRKQKQNNQINNVPDQAQKPLQYQQQQIIQNNPTQYKLHQIQYDYNNLLKYYYDIKEQEQFQEMNIQSQFGQVKQQQQAKKQVNRQQMITEDKRNQFSIDKDGRQSIQLKANMVQVGEKRQTQKNIPQCICLISESQGQNVQEDDTTSKSIIIIESQSQEKSPILINQSPSSSQFVQEEDQLSNHSINKEYEHQTPQQSSSQSLIYPDNQTPFDLTSPYQLTSSWSQQNLHPSPIYQSISESSSQHQISSQLQHENHILSWFQTLHQSLTEFMQKNNESKEVRFQRFCGKDSLDLSESVEEIYTWNRCFRGIIERFGMETVEVSGIVAKQSNLINHWGWFYDKLFITKSGNIYHSQSKSQNELVYLFIQNVTLGHSHLKILIGYHLSSHFKPKLLFLSFLQLPNKIQSLTFKEHLQSNELPTDHKIFLTINTALQTIQVQQVKLIYTSLDVNLLNALSFMKLQQPQNKSNIRITYQMHFESITTLMKQNHLQGNQFVDQEVIRYLSRKIKLSTNYKQIVQSFRCMSKLFEHRQSRLMNSQSNSGQNSLFIHPARLLEYLQIFSQQFSHQSSQQNKFIGLGFTSSSLYFQMDKQNMKDPVHEIGQIFFQNKKSINNLPQLFIFIETVFKSYFNSDNRQIDQSRTAILYRNSGNNSSSKVYRCQNTIKRKYRQEQFFIFSCILERFQLKEEQNQAIQMKFLKMFDVQINEIVKTCHRFVVNTFYRLLVEGLGLTLQQGINNQNKNDGKVKCKIRDCQTGRQFDVMGKLEKNRENDKDMQILDQMSYVEQTCLKKWHCNCRFYQYSGIPCSHEIACALKFNTPIIIELNNFWKRPN